MSDLLDMAMLNLITLKYLRFCKRSGPLIDVPFCLGQLDFCTKVTPLLRFQSAMEYKDKQVDKDKRIKVYKLPDGMREVYIYSSFVDVHAVTGSIYLEFLSVT